MRIIIITLTLFAVFTAVKYLFGILAMLAVAAVVTIAALSFLAVVVNGNNYAYTKKIPTPKSNPPRSNRIR